MRKQSHAKKQTYGWLRRLLVMVCLVGIISIGCAGCGAKQEAETVVTEVNADALRDRLAAWGAAAKEEAEENAAAGKEAAESAAAKADTADGGGAFDGVTDILDAQSEETDVEAYRDSPLLEQLFSYEEGEHGWNLTITGIAEKYRGTFQECMKEITGRAGVLQIPADINGIPVNEIGENAFADKRWIKCVHFPDSLWGIAPGAFRDTGIEYLELPDKLALIGEEAFADCALLTDVRLPDSVVFIGERAFSGNPALWTVLVPDVSAQIGEDAFAFCRSDFLLCYGDNPQGKENLVAAYAEENGIDSMEIFLSKEPVVQYPEEPLILKPEVRNFFWGDYGSYENWEEEKWCSFEEDEAAPNFGYDDWQWPGCSSWCGVIAFTQEAYASSTLPSKDGRYSADNILIQDRESAWAENAAGGGIGESITYCQSCSSRGDKWTQMWQSEPYRGNRDMDEFVRSMDDEDEFMRYTEICIVNGYAKDEKTWEENGRVKQFLMYVENRPYAYLELEDTILPQYFALPEDDIIVLDGGMLEVRFEITQVYPGSVYEDTCLTGLIMEFSGRHGH